MKASRIVVVSLLVGAFGASGASAQTTIKAGVSHADVSNSGALPGDLGPRTGLTIGLAFNGAQSGLLGLGFEGLYAQRGLDGTGGPRLDYIDVPVYLRVMPSSVGINPFAYAGPQISFEVRCRVDGAACPDTGRPHTTYAAVIGAGISLGHALSIEGRYIYGLKDLKLSTVSSTESYQNRSFEILAGISF